MIHQGVVYIAVETETSGSYNPNTQTPIKIKQIGGYASHIWRIEKTDVIKNCGLVQLNLVKSI